MIDLYIEPDSKIQIIANCPLDPTYDHTIWFDDADKQYAYFAGITKYGYYKQSYQRVQRGKIRVEQKADNLYNCNYLCFQNTAYGTKWFYAFISNVEYINDITSEITFEIDVMQTWMFDYTPDMCFVEREHSVTDRIGDNTVPEALEQGQYIEMDAEPIGPVQTVGASIIFITTFNNDAELTNADGKIINGVYSGLNIVVFTSVADANEFIKKVVDANKTEGILSIFMCPFTPTLGSDVQFDSASVTKHRGSLNGYMPKNNKLYCYPYNLLHLQNDTASADFRYEFFAGDTCDFVIRMAIMPEPTIVFIPSNYVVGGEAVEYRLATTHFPQCAFSTDVFKVYLAQNAASLPVSMISSITSGALGVAGAVNGYSNASPRKKTSGILGIVESAVGAVTGVAQDLAQVYDITTKPPQANGSQTSATDFALGIKIMYARKYTIRAEYAKIIDDYFTMYGYATHRVKAPNRNSRPHWNYVKTIGCTITGSVPGDDIVKICQIYNNGITFWKKGAEVGNYSLDNSP